MKQGQGGHYKSRYRQKKSSGYFALVLNKGDTVQQGSRSKMGTGNKGMEMETKVETRVKSAMYSSCGRRIIFLPEF